jgi:hypothetical protein
MRTTNRIAALAGIVIVFLLSNWGISKVGLYSLEIYLCAAGAIFAIAFFARSDLRFVLLLLITLFILRIAELKLTGNWFGYHDAPSKVDAGVLGIALAFALAWCVPAGLAVISRAGIGKSGNASDTPL